MRAHCKICGALVSLSDVVFVEGKQQNDRGHYECRDKKACAERVAKAAKK
jgi:alpha-D-ribose 1-methylphosphonate 5-phosphate C-P lyase